MFTTTQHLSICARCLIRRTLSHRSLSTTSSSSLSNPPPPPPTGFTRLTSRRLLSLHGRDAAHFLQGLTTTNTPHSATSGWYSAFLNAQGRVLHDVFIYPAGHSSAYREYVGGGWAGEEGEQGFLIEVDSEEVERLERWMRRYKLRAKVEMRVVEPGEWAVWSVWDEGTGGGRFETTRKLDGEGIGCADSRAPGMGTRVVVPRDARPEGLLGEEHDEVGLAGYTVRRMLKGVPEGQGEIVRELALPLESCVDFMGGVDFRKGCYVGQELTIRTHHTGVVRKRILPVGLYKGAEAPPRELGYQRDAGLGMPPPPSGTNIVRVGGKGRSVGSGGM